MAASLARPLLSAVLLLLAALAPAHGDELRMGGTGSATKVLEQLAGTFGAETDARIEVIPSLGSSGGIRALIDGVLDVAVSGRPLEPDEKKKGLAIGLQVRTPMVLATSHPNPNGLTREGVVTAFSAQSPSWGDGTAIRVILRPRSESDTAILGQLFPGLASAIESARKRPDIPVAATDQDNAEMAEQVPGSLVGTTLTQLKTEKRKLRTVAIDGVAPSLQAFERGAYPYGKTLYFVLPSTPKPLATRFLQFLRSPEGQQMLREADMIP
jgi:phosphate transport system substrate-binding protein